MGLFSRFLGQTRQQQLDTDIRAEQAHHLELTAQEFEASGLSPAEARREAARRFGNSVTASEDTRRQDLLPLLDDFARELRIALRGLRHSPSYSVVVVIALAFGIGANTAIFSLVDSLLLRSLPYPDSDRLAFIYTKLPDNRRTWANYEDIRDWQKDSRAFQSISGWVSQTASLTGAGDPDRLRAGFVSDNFFSTLAVQPTGRNFLPQEVVPNGPRVAIASWGLWQQKFGGRPDFLGSKINLNGEPYTIIGILPRGFEFPIDKIDVWMPYPTYPPYTGGRADINSAALGRLHPGISHAAAQQELDARAQALATQFPDTNKDRRATIVMPLHQMVVEDYKPLLKVFSVAVLLALLVACANIATLTVSRILSRSRELSIRAALGAGKGRLLVHIFSEQFILSLAGAALGLLLAYAFTNLANLSDLLPSTTIPTVNWQVAAACLGLAVFAALLTGPLPAIPLLRGRLDGVAASTRGSSETAAANRTRRVLVTLSIALSAILLAGAGLFIRSFQALASINPGFRSENLLTMEYRMPQTKYPEKQMQVDFHQRVAEAASRVPGVQSATVMMALPFSGNGSFSRFEIPGQPPAPKGSEPRAQVNRVDPQYFRAMGIPLLQGRGVLASDRLGADGVVVVSKSMAERCWPGENPIGRRLLFPTFDKGAVSVVGVVADSKHSNLEEESHDKAYLAFAQQPHIFGTLAVRTASDAGSYSNAVRAAVWSVDKDQPVWKVRTLESLVERSMTLRLLLAHLTTAFSLFALLLASVGLYGVVSYATTRRARELSIRAAMGATRAALVRLVLNQGLQNIGVGLALGLVAAIPAARLVQDQLFRVEPTDATAYLISAGALTVAALAATLLPARRAAAINPAQVLRQD